MAEDIGGVSLKDRLWRPASKELVLPPHLSPELQPSRAKLFIPKRELQLAPDLPSHGQVHLEETEIYAAVITNMAYEDVKGRLGERAAEGFRSRLNEKVILHAAGLHDCGRISDWPVSKEELESPTYPWIPDSEQIKVNLWGMEHKEHGPRGADIFRDRWEEVDPTLSPQERDQIEYIIRTHTPTFRDWAAKKVDKRKFEEYEDPQELMLRIVQEADTLGLVRTWYSHHTYGEHLDPTVAKLRDRKVRSGKSSNIEGKLRFPRTNELIPIVHMHAYMNRIDPEIQAQFPGPDRSGVAMQTGERLGILKP